MKTYLGVMVAGCGLLLLGCATGEPGRPAPMAGSPTAGASDPQTTGENAETTDGTVDPGPSPEGLTTSAPGDDDASKTSGLESSSSESGEIPTSGEPQVEPITVHFNADGAALEPGPDDAPQWVSALISEPVAFPMYTDQARAAAILADLESIFAPYPFEFTTEDPGQGSSYMMILLSDMDPAEVNPIFPGGLISVSALDCDNATPHDVVLALDHDPSLTPTQIANSIAFSVGTASGLMPNATEGDALAQIDPPTEPVSFNDACLDLSAAEPACAVMPEGLCEAGQQNSHQALLDSFEPRG